jgi:hypothetical protein
MTFSSELCGIIESIGCKMAQFDFAKPNLICVRQQASTQFDLCMSTFSPMERCLISVHFIRTMALL